MKFTPKEQQTYDIWAASAPHSNSKSTSYRRHLLWTNTILSRRISAIENKH